MMKSINYPLIIGAVIILLIMFVVIFGEYLIKEDPLLIRRGKFEIIDNKMVFYDTPGAPNERFIWGTDQLGRDIYSNIVAGAKHTLMIALWVVVFRFLIGIPLGLAAGFDIKFFKGLNKAFSTIFTAVPTLIISMMFLSALMLMGISIIVFVAVLAFVGWSKVAVLVEERTRLILSQDFIEGEIAIGKSRWKILIQNVIPHILSYLIVIVSMEFARALLLICELGLFGIYVGEQVMSDADLEMLGMEGAIMPSNMPEWGSMLASARYGILTGEYWVALYPALAFFISILGFNLFGEGLAHEFEKRDSRALTRIKGLLYHLNPATFIYELKHLKARFKPVIIKALAIAAVVLLVLIPQPKSQFIVDREQIALTFNELCKDEYKGARAESAAGELFQEYAASEFEAFGLTPLYDTGYVDTVSYIKDERYVVLSGTLSIDGREYVHREDFFLENFVTIDTNKQKIIRDDYSCTIVSYLEYEEMKNQNIDEPVAILYDIYYAEKIEQATYNSMVIGVIYSLEDMADYTGTYFGTDIAVPQNIFEELSAQAGNSMHIKVQYEERDKLMTRNVGAVIEGSGDKVLLITAKYNSSIPGQYNLYDSITSSTAVLEIARVLSELEDKPEYTIVFALLDATYESNGGAQVLSRDEHVDDHTMYMYLEFLGAAGYDELVVNTYYLNDYIDESVAFLRNVEERADYNGLEFERIASKDLAYKTDYRTISSMQTQGIVFSGMNTLESQSLLFRTQDDIDNVDLDILDRQIQTIVDVIADFAYNGR